MKAYAYSESDAAVWNEFVLTQPDATFFHRVEWYKVWTTAFNFKPCSLVARQDGAITAVLPLALVRRTIFGTALISSPLCVYGGAIGEPKACAVLEAEAIALGRKLGVGYVELRNRDRVPDTRIVSNATVTFRAPLAESAAASLTAIPRKQRAEVRKGTNAGLTGDFERTVEPFHSIYAESVHRLGTPVFTKRLVEVLLDAFGDDCRVLTIRNGGTPVASVLTFFFRDEVLPYFGGGTLTARKSAATPFMYWRLMVLAIEEGRKHFDFGRSAIGSGAAAFKHNFGFTAQPLNYGFEPVRAKGAPDMDPASGRNATLMRAWQYLPSSIAHRIGPMVYPTVV